MTAKDKATEIGTNLFLKASPEAQTAILNGIGKVQPVVAKAKPHRTKILAGVGALLVIRKLRTRSA